MEHPLRQSYGISKLIVFSFQRRMRAARESKAPGLTTLALSALIPLSNTQLKTKIVN